MLLLLRLERRIGFRDAQHRRHLDEIVVVGKVAGGRANADVRIVPPTLRQRNGLGEAVDVVTVVLRIDLHHHLVRVAIVGDLDAGIVVDLGVRKGERAHGKVLTTLEVTIVREAARMRLVGLVRALLSRVARVETDVLEVAEVLEEKDGKRRIRRDYGRYSDRSQIR